MCIRESFIVTCFQINSGNVQLHMKTRQVGGLPYEENGEEIHRSCSVGVT